MYEELCVTFSRLFVKPKSFYQFRKKGKKTIIPTIYKEIKNNCLYIMYNNNILYIINGDLSVR